MPGTLRADFSGTTQVAIRGRENAIALPLAEPLMGINRMLAYLVREPLVHLVADSDEPGLTIEWNASAITLRIGTAVQNLPAGAYGLRLTIVDTAGDPFELVHPRLPDSNLRVVVGDAQPVAV